MLCVSCISIKPGEKLKKKKKHEQEKTFSGFDLTEDALVTSVLPHPPLGVDGPQIGGMDTLVSMGLLGMLTPPLPSWRT